MHYSDIQFVSYVTNTVRSDPGEDDFQNIALDGTSLDVEARCALIDRKSVV